MVTRFVRLCAGVRDDSGAARGVRRRMLGVGAAAVAVLGAGIPLLLSGSAGANGSSHIERQAAVIESCRQRAFRSRTSA